MSIAQPTETHKGRDMSPASGTIKPAGKVPAAVRTRKEPTRPSLWKVRAGRIVLRLIVPVLLLAAWWAMSRTPINGLFIADPAAAFARVVQDYLSLNPADFFLGPVAHEHFLPSITRALAGLALAILVGVSLGVALGVVPVLAALFQPLIHLGRSLPSPALLGVFFFLFGTGDSPKIFLIAFSVVWPILFNTIHGVESIGENRAHAAAIFKIRSRDVLFRIVLPGASPKIFAGIRTALALSLIVMIISELQRSENGLGYLLLSTQRDFDYTGFWAVLIVLALVGVTFNFIFTIIERRVLAWHRGATDQHE